MCLCPAIVFHQRTLTFRQLTRFGHLCIMQSALLGFDHPRRQTNACGLGEPESTGSS